MTSSLPANTYTDGESEAAHLDTFSPPNETIPFILPPGVTQPVFISAVRELIAAVGIEAVFVGEARAHYVDPYDVHEGRERKVPSAAVAPGTIEDLQSVLKIANEHNIPVWTFSRGKNLGYGGPAPVILGSLALDLHRLNRILEVNDDLHYAVVEPGVTWTELYEYCVENGKQVWPSTPSLGWGSVVGNTLDRGTGFGPTSTHHQHIAGCEIMLANGELVRTGQWGISNSPSAFLSKFTYGPSVEGLFLQSNLGIVTKLSLWMTPQPEAYMACAFSVPNFEDVEVLVDALGPLRRDGTIPSTIWVGNFVEALSIFGRRSDFWNGEGPIPDWRVKELQKEHGIGYWVARFGLYGSKRIVQAHSDEIEETLKDTAPVGTLTGHLFAAEKGQLLDAKTIPFEHGNVFGDRTGKAAHGDYAPIIPSNGKAVLEWMQAVKPIFEASGRELVTDFFMHERHVIAMNMYTYDQSDPKERKAVRKLFLDLHEVSRKRGFGMYRGHVQHMDLVADLNDFNDHAYVRFVEGIKDTVDPNGILSPGKQGIWPEKYRHLRASDRTQVNGTGV